MRRDQSGADRLTCFDDCARLFKPIGHEIGSAWNAVEIQQAKVVNVTLMRGNVHLFPHLAAAEEGWVADDEVGLGPGRFVGLAFGVVAHDGVGVLDVVELLQDGVALFEDVVLVFPLEEADPDDDGGELVGVELRFDAEELGWRGHPLDGVGDGDLDVVLDGEVAGFLPEVEEAAEGDVEEVSGAACRVEDADGG